MYRTPSSVSSSLCRHATWTTLPLRGHHRSHRNRRTPCWAQLESVCVREVHGVYARGASSHQKAVRPFRTGTSRRTTMLVVKILQIQKLRAHPRSQRSDSQHSHEQRCLRCRVSEGVGATVRVFQERFHHLVRHRIVNLWHDTRCRNSEATSRWPSATACPSAVIPNSLVRLTFWVTCGSFQLPFQSSELVPVQF